MLKQALRTIGITLVTCTLLLDAGSFSLAAGTSVAAGASDGTTDSSTTQNLTIEIGRANV
ncbi:hypothetical protein E4V51_04795 [Paenibacillus sp. 28ISP30-2]|nr:hypothetical protein [Paenibacillus sp. 28ISP30-2]